MDDGTAWGVGSERSGGGGVQKGAAFRELDNSSRKADKLLAGGCERLVTGGRGEEWETDI